jgi:COP9 signalosome complex subunit 3
MLDPSINTIPYLFTLLANIAANASVISHSSFSVSKVLWTKMLDFMDKFDPVQIRYVGHDFVRLIEWVERAGDLEMNVLSPSAYFKPPF